MLDFLASESSFLTKSNYKSLEFFINNFLLYSNEKIVLIILKDFNFSAIFIFPFKLLILSEQLIL